MAKEDMYEILPKDAIDKLKCEINKLKNGGLDNVQNDSHESVVAMNKLQETINSLVELFKTAKDSMGMEEKEYEVIAKKLDPLYEKIDILIDQNRKIAQGIITVADMIKSQQRMPPTMPLPNMRGVMPQPVAKPTPVPRPSPPQIAPGLGNTDVAAGVSPPLGFPTNQPTMPSGTPPPSLGPMPPPPPPPKKKDLYG